MILQATRRLFHIIEMPLFRPDDLIIFMSFARKQNNVAWFGVGKDLLNRGVPIEFEMRIGR